MEFVFEIIMEILVEGFFEGFAALADAFFPQKGLSDRAKKILTPILVIVAVALAFGTFIGVVLLIESGGRRSLGWWLVGAGVFYLAFGIGLKIWAGRKKEKRGTEF